MVIWAPSSYSGHECPACSYYRDITWIVSALKCYVLLTFSRLSHMIPFVGVVGST